MSYTEESILPSTEQSTKKTFNICDFFIINIIAFTARYTYYQGQYLTNCNAHILPYKIKYVQPGTYTTRYNVRYTTRHLYCVIKYILKLPGIYYA